MVSLMIIVAKCLSAQEVTDTTLGHLVEILTNVVNVGASTAIVVLLAWLVGQLRTQGTEVVLSRLFLRRGEASRAIVLVLLGLLTFIASNVLELIGDVFHLDWVVNEVVETGALFVMVAGLAAMARILRIPQRAPLSVHAAIPRGERQ